MVVEIPHRRIPTFVGWFNPVARRLLRVGPLLGPNALITIRGRKTGMPRTTPVALVELDGRSWVVGTFGDTNWVRNLRAARVETLSVGKHETHVIAAELSRDERSAFFAQRLGPYARSLPIGTLLLSVLGARDIVDDPARAAEHRPVFELSADKTTDAA